jgi:hypothetical protein
MTRVELAWWNYEQANKRIDRCRAAHDYAGLAIAETSAKHWHEQWAAELRAADARSISAVTAA